MIPGSMRRNVARQIKRYGGGTVTLTRRTPAAAEPETPWTPGLVSTEVYDLDAVVAGVTADHVDGTLILASDLVVTVAPFGRHTLSDGEAADGALVEIAPALSDTLTIEGAAKIIKSVRRVPAAGPVACFRLFVAS